MNATKTIDTCTAGSIIRNFRPSLCFLKYLHVGVEWLNVWIETIQQEIWRNDRVFERQ